MALFVSVHNHHHRSFKVAVTLSFIVIVTFEMKGHIQIILDRFPTQLSCPRECV